MKCVAQIPHPAAAPAATTHVARARPRVARARLNRLIAVRLAKKQTTPATMTRRQSCSVVRQVRTRNMIVLERSDFRSRYLVNISLTLITRASMWLSRCLLSARPRESGDPDPMISTNLDSRLRGNERKPPRVERCSEPTLSRAPEVERRRVLDRPPFRRNVVDQSGRVPV